MKNENYFLSRIDRSVADNLKDIEKSFDEDAGIVKDFIVFMTKKLQINMFGYAKFTLDEFSRETGRNKQDLCMLHPKFVNSKAKPPEYFGHKFQTVFDYALFNMLQRNIIFSKAYTYSSNNQTIVLENFPILKDIKLNIDRAINAVKVYDVRISNEWLDGFIQRYYTIETNGYRLVGKGRGGDGRKNLYIFLYKIRHQLITQHQFITKIPVDYLCNIASIQAAEPKHKKLSLRRTLDQIIEKGGIPLTYGFVQGDPTKEFQESYWVELNFFAEAKELTERKGDNFFFKVLISELRMYYSHKWGETKIKDEKDPFQRWLINQKTDVDFKADCLMKAYYKAYDINLIKSDAIRLINEGIFSAVR